MRRYWEHDGRPLCQAAFWPKTGQAEITVDVRHIGVRAAAELQRALGEAISQVREWQASKERGA